MRTYYAIYAMGIGVAAMICALWETFSEDIRRFFRRLVSR